MSNAVRFSFLTFLRDQLLTLGSLVLLVGYISTEVYYQYFGIKFQTLNLGPSHLVYRGITGIWSYPLILISYCAGFVIISSDHIFRSSAVGLKVRRYRVLSLLVAVTALLLFTFTLSKSYGQNSARRDFSGIPGVSTLPEIVATTPAITSLISFDCSENPFQCENLKFRLLLIDHNYIYVFNPIHNEAAIPYVHRIKKDSFSTITTSAR